MMLILIFHPVVPNPFQPNTTPTPQGTAQARLPRSTAELVYPVALLWRLRRVVGCHGERGSSSSHTHSLTVDSGTHHAHLLTLPPTLPFPHTSSICLLVAPLCFSPRYTSGPRTPHHFPHLTSPHLSDAASPQIRAFTYGSARVESCCMLKGGRGGDTLTKHTHALSHTLPSTHPPTSPAQKLRPRRAQCGG